MIPCLAGAAAIDADTFFVVFSVVLMSFYSFVVGTKVIAVLAGLRKDVVAVSSEEIRGLTDEQCPVYTVLVPLYKEAEIVEDLVRALEALDYPRSKLDVKLLLEADDRETAEKIKTITLPPWIEALTVPDGVPRTKPRACNYGLEHARGEFLVIFDAEDRPDANQLKKAVCAFRKLSEKAVCLQAKLNFFNRSHNFVTRFFTLEYTAWFDLYLPGLHALGAPIPLGGTSNHFRTAPLREIGGWDAYNVTEDCDLGIYLQWSGGQTHILDSTTWEEAPTRWWAWVKQRSRWLKGYWQTHLVHTREPLQCLQALGIWKTLLMVFTVGGQVISLLINPFCWMVGIAWLVFQWPLFDPNRPWTLILVIAATALLLSNFLFVVVHMLGAAQRGFHSLVPVAVLLPFYWLMLSVGAWRGFLQFFYAPFLWEKTQHGIGKSTVAGQTMVAPINWGHRVLNGVVVLSIAALIGLVAWRTPVWLKYYDQIQYAQIKMLTPDLEHEIPLDESWLGKQRLEIDVSLDEPPVPPEQAGEEMPKKIFRAVINLKVWDGEWYQIETADMAFRPGGATFRASLLDGWNAVGVGSARPWVPDVLRRVRAVGVRMFGETNGMKNLKITRAEPVEFVPRKSLEATLIGMTKEPARLKQFQADFELNRVYQNPFDPDEIDVWGTFSDESGNKYRVPAFYNQDYTRGRDGEKEVLHAHGKPKWSVRFAPPAAGYYMLKLSGKDKLGGKFETAEIQFQAGDSTERGFVKVDNDKRYFSFQNGDFYYPIGMNIRSPGDDLDKKIGTYHSPSDEQGTFVMDEFLEKMGAAKMNFARIWSAPWFAGLEWSKEWNGYHGLGVYNLQNAWRMDHVLEVAASKGMLVEIAINSHGPFTLQYDSQWKQNPYNAANGGPLKRPADLMTNKEGRRWMKNRLRYLAARYGANPYLFGWTLFIEIETVNDNTRDLVAWHQEMGPYLKEMDFGKHIVSTEFNGYGVPEVFHLPCIEYVQCGAYSFGRGLVSQFKENVKQLQRYNKPIVLEEYGGHAQGGSLRWTGHEIHDGLWAGWFMRTGSVPLAWWWNMIFAHKLERHYKQFADYTAGEDLRNIDWKHNHRKVSGPGADNLAALLRTTKDRAYVWVFSSKLIDFQTSNRDYWRQGYSASEHYDRVAGKFDPLAEITGDQFEPLSGCSVDLHELNLEAGTYEVEYWDTWTNTPPEKAVIEVNGERPKLPLPRLTRDLAIKLKKK
ncbi:MAG TPA: glycosyltransferase [Planctomycetota bacterium]|nr:glycosyltransferase [Planctomycetota bacterium]